MEMHQVRYFMALSETLNFTKAAELCGVAQPTLTKAIQKLEEELGGPLFLRERNLTQLSDLGRLVRPHIEQTLRASEMTLSEADGFHKMERGSLRLGVMCTIGPARLVGFLKQFRRNAPTVEVALRDAPAGQVVELLMEGEIDAALVARPQLPERCDSFPLYSERYMVAFAPGHRFEEMDVVPLKELDHEDYLNRINCEYPEHFSVLGIPDPADVNVCYESEREDWIQALILAGMGCSIMPEFLPTLPGIATRPVIEPELSRSVKLVTVAGRRFSPALRIFLSLARGFDWARMTA